MRKDDDETANQEVTQETDVSDIMAYQSLSAQTKESTDSSLFESGGAIMEALE